MLWGKWTGLVSWGISLTEWIVRQPFQGGTPMAFFLCSHSVPLGQNPGTPAGQDDAWLPAEAGAGWQNYHHSHCSVIVTADSRFPPASAWNLLTPALLCAQVALLRVFLDQHLSRKTFSLKQAEGQGRGRRRNSLVTQVGEDTWGFNPRLLSNSPYTVSQLLPASCSTWCHRTSAFLLGGGWVAQFTPS